MDELDLHHSHRVLGQKSKLVVSKLSTSEVATILKEGKGAVKPLHLRDVSSQAHVTWQGLVRIADEFILRIDSLLGD
jgi:hypothetical protein